MSKLNEYASGRSDGLQLALKLVKTGGIDALKEEIRFRGITGINTVMCKKEVEQGSQKIKEMTCDTIMCCQCSHYTMSLALERNDVSSL